MSVLSASRETGRLSLTRGDEWYNTVVDGGRKFMDAWREIGEQASETRQEKRMEKETLTS